MQNNTNAIITPSRICATCGTASAVPAMPGSGWIEAILWMYIIPGLIYSIWRRSKKSSACPACGAKTIPLDTPAGLRLAMRHYPRGLPVLHEEAVPPRKSSKLALAGLFFMFSLVIYSVFILP